MGNKANCLTYKIQNKKVVYQNQSALGNIHLSWIKVDR